MPSESAVRSSYGMRGIIVLCAALLLTALACGVDRSQVINGPARMSRPFLVILCEANDNPTPLNPLSYYQKLFDNSSPELDNVYNFFLDQSYGAIDLASTTILNWTQVKSTATTPTNSDDLRKLSRDKLTTICMSSATGKVDHWGKYVSGGVITIWNVTGLDDGAWCCFSNPDGGSQNATNAGANPALGGADPTTVAFFTHEMTHNLGVNHAHGPFAGETYSVLNELDTGPTHTFGQYTRTEDYGDCWSIMGCGSAIFDTGGFGAGGPGLDGAERAIFGWTPRILTYKETDTAATSVTLDPRGDTDPHATNSLLVKIPVGSQGYYTVEYVEKTGWDRAVWLDHAVLIHEVRSADPSHSYLVARNIYGAWLAGQVFFDPVNHVRISIDKMGDTPGSTATVTVSRDGKSDDKPAPCAPMGYVNPGIGNSAPNIILEAPLDGAHAVAGVPITLQATVQQLVDTGLGSAEPIPEDQITWTDDGAKLKTGSTFTYAFTSARDHTIMVSAYNKYCLANSRSVTLHVDPAPTTPQAPSVSILQPLDGALYVVNPPAFTQSVTLVAAGSSNVATFTWTDTLTGFLGSGQDQPVNLKLTATGNCAYQTDTITLRGTTSAGAFATASITVTLKSSNCIK